MTIDTAILEDLGLTPTEIRAYTALLTLGNAAAGAVRDKAGLQNAVTHRALHALAEKGIVSFVIVGKHRVYQATDPESFYHFLDEKKKRFTELLPRLKQLQQQGSDPESATVYKGVRGVKEAYHLMVGLQGKEYLTFGGGPPCVDLMGLPWWLNLHERRIENKLASRQVFDALVKELGGAEIGKKPLTSIRYLPADFAQFQETVIVGDAVMVAVFTRSPYAFVVKDAQVADGYRKYFQVLWEKAKK
jgi:sugar-specific transcriptional regulator TrmB